jgi:trans-aconitate 2-methyltransferase
MADRAHHSSLQAAMADEMLSRLVLSGDEQVLDLGCGDGKISGRIAAQLPRGAVLGVDAGRPRAGMLGVLRLGGRSDC